MPLPFPAVPGNTNEVPIALDWRLAELKNENLRTRPPGIMTDSTLPLSGKAVDKALTLTLLEDELGL